jgi:hypothetical protein
LTIKVTAKGNWSVRSIGSARTEWRFCLEIKANSRESRYLK